MKELSIEENAKVYTELINRFEDVKDAIKKQNYGIAMDILCKPYPVFQITTSTELKESENEKIRKQITGFITYSRVLDETKKIWLAWLEKQGEQKLIDKIQLGKKYKCIASPRYSTFMTGEIYKPEDKFLCSLMNFCSDCFEPIEDSEQKPVDKAEPKFKIEKGKWYVCIKDLLDNYANKAFYEGDIYLSTQDGSLIPSNSNVPFKVVCPDTYFRDWTIQDAKAGDVLVTGNKNIFIFKSISGYTIYDYCGLYFEKFANSSGTVNGTAAKHLPTDYAPATKEQRDLLFSKMKEAGYTWDADKKELKKEKEVYNLHNYLYGKQNPIWSEGDKEMYKKVETAIDSYYAPFSRDAEEMSEWFKNLKNRVKPQPKQEWSEEVEDAISLLKHIADEQEEDSCPYNANNLRKAAQYLETCRPQNTWKPSDEQIKGIECAIKTLKYQLNAGDNRLNSLYDDLKKLREE